VTRLMNFGAFVEILPGKEGLVHISELSNQRLAKVEDAVKVGDEIEVRVKEIDNLGRVNLTRRGLIPGDEAVPADGEDGATPGSDAPAGAARPPRFDRGPRGDRGPHRPHRKPGS